MKEFNQAAKDLEAALRDFNYAIKSELTVMNIANFALDINLSGRVDGESKLEFKLAPESYSFAENMTKGGDLIAVFKEMLRRRGFTKRYDALALPNLVEQEPRNTLENFGYPGPKKVYDFPPVEGGPVQPHEMGNLGEDTDDLPF